MICFVGMSDAASSAPPLARGVSTFVEGGRVCALVLYVITDLLRVRPTHSDVCYCLLCYRQKNEVHRERQVPSPFTLPCSYTVNGYLKRGVWDPGP